MGRRSPPTHRLMRTFRLRRRMLALADVAVMVSNAKVAAKWWNRNLGFSQYTIGGSGHAIMVAPPGDRFVLHLCEGFAPLEPGDTGIAFVTDGMDALVARLAKAGVQIPVPPNKEEGSRMAKFADPDGNIFWLIGVPTAFVQATLGSRAPSVRRPAATRRARRKSK